MLRRNPKSITVSTEWKCFQNTVERKFLQAGGKKCWRTPVIHGSSFGFGFFSFLFSRTLLPGMLKYDKICRSIQNVHVERVRKCFLCGDVSIEFSFYLPLGKRACCAPSNKLGWRSLKHTQMRRTLSKDLLRKTLRSCLREWQKMWVVKNSHS